MDLMDLLIDAVVAGLQTVLAGIATSAELPAENIREWYSTQDRDSNLVVVDVESMTPTKGSLPQIDRCECKVLIGIATHFDLDDSRAVHRETTKELLGAINDGTLEAAISVDGWTLDALTPEQIVAATSEMDEHRRRNIELTAKLTLDES